MFDLRRGIRMLSNHVICFSGTSQIRRVRLPRIADAAGNVSYEELVGLVVTFTFPAESSAEKFDCTLTYFDQDEDTVTIASTAELVDAVEQFVDQKVLRISTEVKRKASTTASIPASTQTQRTSYGTTDRGTSTKSDNIEANLQNVLESFASVIVTAVSALEKGIAESAANGSSGVASAYVSKGSSESKPQASEEAAAKPATEPAVESSASVESPEPAAEEKAAPFIHRRHTCDSCLMNPVVGTRYHAVNMMDYDLCEKCFPNYSGKETEFISYPSGEKVLRFEKAQLQVFPDSVESFKGAPYTRNAIDHVNGTPPCRGFSEANTQGTLTSPPVSTKPAPQETAAPVPASSNESEPAPVDRPFIHGRHTCDSCLMNPIVGKRYNSTNLKDYDLCENCYSCYQGTEIQFQPVELGKFPFFDDVVCSMLL